MAKKLLFTNLAKINDHESKFFLSLFESLASYGHIVKFWSAAPKGSLKKYTIPMDFRIGNWPNLYPKEIFSKKIRKQNLDYNKWLSRINMLQLQDCKGYTADDLLDIIIRVTLYNFEIFNPDVYFSWNTFCPHTGIGADLARERGIKTFLIERGFLPDTYFIEEGGLVGHSILAGVHLDSLFLPSEKSKFFTIGDKYVSNNSFLSFNRYSQIKTPFIHEKLFSGDWSKKKPRVVFFPPDDQTLGFFPLDGEDRKKHSPYFQTSLLAAEKLAYYNNSGLTIFKPHPSFEDSYLEKYDIESNLVILDQHFLELIDWADVVSTTGSGLAFIALAKGKPVLHLGRDQLIGKNIVYEIKKQEDISVQLAAAYNREGMEEKLENFKIFIGYCLTNYLVSNPNDSFSFLTPKKIVDKWSLDWLTPDQHEQSVNKVNNNKETFCDKNEVFLSDGKKEEVFSILKDNKEKIFVLDFDNTLLLHNSTELFLSCSHPRWMAAFIRDLVVKFKLWNSYKKPASSQDQITIWLITIFMPWVWIIWFFCGKNFGKKFANTYLLPTVRESTKDLYVISFGFKKVIRPLLDGMGLKNACLMASDVNPYAFDMRKSGKANILFSSFDADKCQELCFISDSEDDKDLFDKIPNSHLIVWKEYPEGALSKVYYPFRYASMGKYFGHAVFRRHRLYEDIPVIMLCYAPFINKLFVSISLMYFAIDVFVLFILFISFNAVYEIGYYENDFQSSKFEDTPNIPKNIKQFEGMTIHKYAWMWSIILSLLAFSPVLFLDNKKILFSSSPASFFYKKLALLLPTHTWDNILLFAILFFLWIFCLIVTYYAFKLHNKLRENLRIFSFNFLHFIKLAIYASCVPLLTSSLVVMFAQVSRHLNGYYVYRYGGNSKEFPRKLIRLCFFVLATVLLLLVPPSLSKADYISIILAGLLFSFTAIKEFKINFKNPWLKDKGVVSDYKTDVNLLENSNFKNWDSAQPLKWKFFSTSKGQVAPCSDGSVQITDNGGATIIFQIFRVENETQKITLNISTEGKCNKPSDGFISLACYDGDDAQTKIDVLYLADSYSIKNGVVELPLGTVRYNLCLRCDNNATANFLWVCCTRA